MSRTVIRDADREYFGFEDAARYLQAKGLDGASRHTIDHHYRRTRKLGKPKRVGRRQYWSRDQLDALLDAL